MPVLTAHALLLDMDGTLVNSDAVVERIWRRWADAHGLDGDEVMKVVHGRQGHDSMAVLLPGRPMRLNLEDNARMLAAETADLDGVVPVPGAPEFLASPIVSVGTTALAMYELIGDKQASAPDRIITPAVIVRTLNAAFAGAAVAPRERRWLGAALAGGTAAAAAYGSWWLRMRAMRGGGQALTGFIEDAVVVPLAIAAATR